MFLAANVTVHGGDVVGALSGEAEWAGSVNKAVHDMHDINSNADILLYLDLHIGDLPRTGRLFSSWSSPSTSASG